MNNVNSSSFNMIFQKVVSDFKKEPKLYPVGLLYGVFDQLLKPRRATVFGSFFKKNITYQRVVASQSHCFWFLFLKRTKQHNELYGYL
jgi:hypothetical protein